MSRKFCCDRCQKEFNTWVTTAIEMPATACTFKLNFDLCSSCLAKLRALVMKFVEEDL